MFHRETESALGVISSKVNVRESGAVPILSDGVVMFEDIAHVVSMSVLGAFDARLVNNEDELDGVPVVVPKARSGGHLIVASCIESSFKEFVCKDSCLRETIDAFSDFKVDPTIMNIVEGNVFMDRF